MLHNSSFFHDNYISIDTVVVQKKSSEIKNLILIIMESIENTFADSASGGIQQKNLIQELMPADSNEYHFSSNGLIGGGFNTIGTDLTISATIAKTTGLPVLLKNTYSDTLLEKVPSIYNILQKFGFSNVFIQGTDANFSGTKNFVLSHGIHTLYDIHSLKQQQDINEQYRNFRSFEVGITDRTILDISKHILDSLTKKEHFSLTIATIETHFPYGFYNKACEDKPINSTEQATLEATIRCASKDMRNFVNWIKQQPFYPNTEIIIVGDHLFMGNYLVNNSKNRRWYNLYINPAIKPQTTKREFTSFDIAPTILESLGFTIENHKMGFGVSLFSEESTLVEKIGIDLLNKELTDMQKSVEYNELSHPVNIIPSI
jgi:phosphoglycerol transferase MdoB-like AlkP superfamily enzyme